MEIVSPAYQERLDNLAEALVNPSRFGGLALQDTVELEIPDNIVLGVE